MRGFGFAIGGVGGEESEEVVRLVLLLEGRREFVMRSGLLLDMLQGIFRFSD